MIYGELLFLPRNFDVCIIRHLVNHIAKLYHLRICSRVGEWLQWYKLIIIIQSN